MQEYVWFLLLFNQMITVSFCYHIIEEENRSNFTQVHMKEKYLENRRNLSIFPKNTIKFVVTPKPDINQVYTYRRKEKIMTKMPLIPYVTPKVKTLSQTSRKPLMNLRTFTIQSRGNGNNKNIEKLTQNHPISKKTEISRSGIRFDPVMQHLEDHITVDHVPEESQINIANTSIFESSVEFLVNEQIKQDENKKSVIIKSKTNKISSEEEQDRKEFIFLEKKKDNQFFSDLLDNNDQDVERDVETSTEVSIKENYRFKRSKNIIEEENMGTTVSTLKITGQDTRLVNNDMYFKNIHA